MNTSTRSRPVCHLAVALVAGLLVAGILTACESNNSPEPPKAADTTATTPATTDTTTTEAQTTETQTTETQTSTQQASAAGKEVFTQNCGSCHTLSDAGTSGQVGPNLDQLKPGPELVTSQVTNGGGGMPAFANKLSEEQIKQISDYVAENSGT